jgi:hypothetical protein
VSSQDTITFANMGRGGCCGSYLTTTPTTGLSATSPSTPEKIPAHFGLSATIPRPLRNSFATQFNATQPSRYATLSLSPKVANLKKSWQPLYRSTLRSSFATQFNAPQPIRSATLPSTQLFPLPKGCQLKKKLATSPVPDRPTPNLEGVEHE